MDRVITILSDVGRVAVDFDNDRAARALSLHSRYDAAQIRYLLFHDRYSLCHPFERGLMGPEEFRARVRALLELDNRLTDADFDDAFSDIFTLIGPVVDLWQKLRRRGVPVFALSNVDPIRFQFVAERVSHDGVPFRSLFDGFVLSFKEGVAKPDTEIFTRALDRAGSKAEDALFIDDIPAYVEVARGMGIRAHVQKPWDVEGLIEFLAQNGLEEILWDH